MTSYDEIRRILTEELGFTDLAAYKRWIEETRPRTRPTAKTIERLSPDRIDCRAFWKVCDELFGTDPVCNQVVPSRGADKPVEASSTMDANRLNLMLAKQLGVTTFIDQLAQTSLSMLEIGAGFGSLKNYIETQTRHTYAGVDVVPRVPGVIEATEQGFLPDHVRDEYEGALTYVVSSNVFQHLSAAQRSRYFKDVHALLAHGGLFIFNLHVDTGQLPENMRDESGQAWCDHYAQYTLIPKPDAIHRELKASYEIMYVTQRYDGIFNFVCQKTK